MSDFGGISLKGKTAIVTGSSRGIGAGIAVQLAKRGANVVVNYVSEGSKARAQEVVDEITKIGTKAILCHASVMKLEEIPRLVEAALKISETGKIEIIVHNAALGLEANLVDTSLDLYTTHFDCNVRGPIFLTKEALPHLPRGGRIVFISSAAARLGVAGHTVYGPTKAANEALVRVWAKELGHSHGITVNCVNPGPVATDQWLQSDPQFIKDMQPMIDETPAAPRVGEVDDIAPLVAFLCSEDAKWTTGSCLSANGGLYN
ncbi:hypothetical protein PENSTE_c017G03972 [Penicillium steckii]|uniref:Uncharacterized protein n=1 Tax=Penicillium steckii TaxID=303698 RepID=A0A1V6SY95_9EURO|nr:hypothetical protein PENSTE_c017G03972 [Penicillium steckii]